MFCRTQDISVPPPVFLLRDRGAGDIRRKVKVRYRHRDRDVLVLVRKRASGGLEYDLRRALTDSMIPGARTDGNTTRRTRRLRETCVIRFRVPSKNYTSLLKRAKYGLVTEGFSPWSPRLTEAVAHGCVPVFLSPLLRPPYASVLDYSKFSGSTKRHTAHTFSPKEVRPRVII